jgi:hypothetical protein
VIALCIRPSGSSGKSIISYGYGRMDKFGLCLTQNNVRALCGMFMSNWAILGFNKPIVCSMHNINSEGCNYMFNNLFHGVWSNVNVIQCTYISFPIIAHLKSQDPAT